MNERIKALADKADIGWDDKYQWYVGRPSLEKFAKLIIEDSISIAKEINVTQDNAWYLSRILKNRFGIEE
jgi:hypothetical protein